MRCGIGDYTQRLASAMANLPGVHVEVMTSQSAGSRLDGFVSVRADVSNWHAQSALQAWRTLARLKPDVVHVQFPTQGYGSGRLASWLPLFAWLKGAVVVQTWHEPSHRRDLAWFLLRALVPGSIIVVRPGFREMLHPWLSALLFRRELRFVRNASSIPVSGLSREEQVQLRSSILGGRRRLIVHFGFLYPFKGLDLVFEVANPETDRVVVIGKFEDGSDYEGQIETRIEVGQWKGEVRFLGHLPSDEVSDILAVSDAVVLPFRAGGGEWNTSIHGAVANGARVITTSADRRGLDMETGVHYCPIDDVAAMRRALDDVPDWTDRKNAPMAGVDVWRQVASEHVSIYRGLLRR
jgi:glycosyltransferase involved in cell wall biosynthesis